MPRHPAEKRTRVPRYANDSDLDAAVRQTATVEVAGLFGDDLNWPRRWRGYFRGNGLPGIARPLPLSEVGFNSLIESSLGGRHALAGRFAVIRDELVDILRRAAEMDASDSRVFVEPDERRLVAWLQQTLCPLLLGDDPDEPSIPFVRRPWLADRRRTFLERLVRWNADQRPAEFPRLLNARELACISLAVGQRLPKLEFFENETPRSVMRKRMQAISAAAEDAEVEIAPGKPFTNNRKR